MKLTKISALILAVSAISVSTISAASNSKEDDISYSVGYTIGKYFKTGASQLTEGKISVDNTEVISGFKDGINGQNSKITPKQMSKAISEFRKQVIAMQKNAKSKS